MGQRPLSLADLGAPFSMLLEARWGLGSAAFESLCSLPRSQAGIWVEGVVRWVGWGCEKPDTSRRGW